MMLITTATRHAVERLGARAIRPEHVAFARLFGRVTYRTGVKFVFLGYRDIPEAFQRSHGHLEGLTLILCSRTDVLITGYRNPAAIADIKRKGLRDLKRSRRGKRPASAGRTVPCRGT